MPTLDEYATHSPFSDPGAHRELLAATGTSADDLHRAVTAVVRHYRGERTRLTDVQLTDVDLRWVEQQLALAQQRCPGPLTTSRADEQYLAGCCRDHTLLAVAVLREHGIPARSRVGFADYFEPDFHHDHVVVERWDGARWVRLDSELDPQEHLFDVHDMPAGEGMPFETAAEVWLAARAGRIDPQRYGVDKSMPHLIGMPFLLGEVFLELAHRQRDEVLLWDVWGPGIPPFAQPDGSAPVTMSDDEMAELADEVARLVVAADDGDEDADTTLDGMYASQARLRPTANPLVVLSPLERIGDVDLVARTTAWR